MRPKKSGLRRFAVTLEYDGASFAGFQLQSNAHTVQLAVEDYSVSFMQSLSLLAPVRKRAAEKRQMGPPKREFLAIAEVVPNVAARTSRLHAGIHDLEEILPPRASIPSGRVLA